MSRQLYLIAAIAFVLVALTSVFQLAEIPLAAAIALTLGIIAGGRAHALGQSAARAGVLVGVGALLGAVVGLARTRHLRRHDPGCPGARAGQRAPSRSAHPGRVDCSPGRGRGWIGRRAAGRGLLCRRDHRCAARRHVRPPQPGDRIERNSAGGDPQSGAAGLVTGYLKGILTPATLVNATSIPTHLREIPHFAPLTTARFGCILVTGYGTGTGTGYGQSE